MLNLLKKKIFKNNHFSRGLLDLENWWCILAQFVKPKQICGKGRTLKSKKTSKIPYALHFSVYLLIIISILHAKFPKNACLQSCWWCKIRVKWSICSNQQQGPLLEISYIPLLSVMTLHYHRLYQISSLEANLSLEDMKYLAL